ncbi:hypothetical protein ACHAXS_000468 [Conticribra weissflogii]
MIHAQGEECNICLSSFQVGDLAAWTRKGGCVHAFHEECISKWLLVREGCPMCRRSFLLGESEDEDGYGRIDGDADSTAEAGDVENVNVGGAAGNVNVADAAVRDLERGWGGTGFVAVEEEDDEDADEEQEEELCGQEDRAASTTAATVIAPSSSLWMPKQYARGM